MSSSQYVLKLHDCENPDRTVYSVETRAGERFDTVQIEPITPQPETEWLWPGQIALGKVTVLEGAPGSGKSRVAFDLAARVRDRLAWPDGTPNSLPAADVLVISRHDEAGAVAAGDNSGGENAFRLFRFHGFHTACPETDEHGDRPVAFPFDLEALQVELENRTTIGVVIIDPLSDFCATPKLLSETLHQLNDLAQRARVAIIATVPANCRTDARGSLRVTSRWPTDAARCVWSLIADPDDPSRRLLVARRMNFCREPDGLAFRIDDKGRVAWEADSAISPVDPLGVFSTSEQLLKELLMDGPLQASIVFRLGAEHGLKPRELRTAAKRLGITCGRVGFGGNGHWVWRLAEKAVCVIGEGDEAIARSESVSPSPLCGGGSGWGGERLATPDSHADPPPSMGKESPDHDAPSLSESIPAAGPEEPACDGASAKEGTPAECDARPQPAGKSDSPRVSHVRPLSKRKARRARQRLAQRLAAEVVGAVVPLVSAGNDRFATQGAASSANSS